MEELLKGGFADIKTILQQELMGVNCVDVDSKHEENTGLVENTSIRELLEKVSFKLDSALELLQIKINGRSPANSGLAVESTGLMNFLQSVSTGKDIRALTDSQEQIILHEEMEVERDLLKDENTEAALGKFTENVEARKLFVYVTVNIENYLEVELNQLDYFLEHDSDYWILDSKPDFPPGTSSLLTITDHANYSWIRGLLSFRIQGEGMRLVIKINQASMEYSSVSVAFVPDCLPMTSDPFPFDKAHSEMWECMTSKRWFKWDKTYHGVVVRHREIQAKVYSTGTSFDNRNISILITKRPVVIGSIEAPDALENKINVLKDGKTVFDKTIPNLLHYSLDNYDCIMEISNYLNVSLTHSKTYLENGKAQIAGPQFVFATTREVLIVKTNFNGNSNGGLVTYQIGNTDLRLAVAFQLFNSGNKFAVGFVKTSIPTDSHLMAFLTNPNNWSTCLDHKYGGAKYGEQIIETRNIRACASMTDGIKAHLKVFVATF